MSSTVSLESLSFQIDPSDPIAFPDKLSLESLSFQIQPAFENVELYNVLQLGEGKGWYLLRETSAGVWESAYKIDVNPTSNSEVQAVWDAATGLYNVSKLTAQQFMDAIAVQNSGLEAVFLEDRNVAVDAADQETNMTLVAVTLAEGTKPIYTMQKL